MESNTATAPAAPTSSNEIYMPFGIYKLRCLECTKGKSRNDNPQFVMTWEVIEHKQEKFNGIKFTNFRTLTEKALFFVNQERQAIGLPDVKASDLETLDPNDYIAAHGYATVQTKINEQKNEETGEVLVNPNTGEKLITVRRELVNWCKR